MKKKITESIVGVIGEMDKTISRVEKDVESVITPIQKTAFARFPILFTLLVTFGVAVTFLGFERIVTDITYINDRPLFLLSIGIGILTLTGTLYKKLG